MEKSIRRSYVLSTVLLLNILVAPVLADATPVAASDYANVTNGQLVANRTYTTPDPLTEASFSGVVSFDGDVVFRADTNKVLKLSIGRNTGPVFFKPLLGTASTPKYAHLIFEPSANGIIEVDIYNDLVLTGSNLNDSMLASSDSSGNYDNTPLTVTFRGAGTTVFNMSDGKKLIVSSVIEDNAGNLIDTDVPASLFDRKPQGTSMYVAMDQNNSDVVKKGLNKIVFKRQMFPLGGHNDCEFRIGLNSFLTFISKNYLGLDSTTQQTNPTIPVNTDGSSLQSYAAIAFDVSNFDEGKMVLNIAGPSNVFNSYTDGSFMLVGHYLQDSSNNLTAVPGDYLNNDHIRNFVNFSQPAGCKAFLRVIDNQAYLYDSLTNGVSIGYVDSLNPTGGEVGVIDRGTYSGLNSRRGLLIRCSNKSHPPLASNPYGDSSWYRQEVYNSGRGNFPVRNGCVLGINGHIEVSHNTFLEYEAAAPNSPFDPDSLGMTILTSVLSNAGITDSQTLFKNRNASGLIVDGLGSVTVGGAEQIMFVAHSRGDIVRRAEITTFGNAGLNFRAPLLYSAPSVVARGFYDGKRLAINGETLGDGVGVLNVEGPLTIRSLPDNGEPFGLSGAQAGYLFGLHVSSLYRSAGVFRLGSLWRSFDDREIVDQNAMPLTSYVTRPLVFPTGVSPVGYVRYDRPSVLLNDNLDFIDIDYHHEDVSRYIIPNVTQSPPVFCGGERAHVLNKLYGFQNPDLPYWRIYNSRIHCHESMCVSGCRLVVRELPDILSLAGNVEQNLSSIIMYNHGDLLDTNLKGFSRIFLLGSKLNTTGSGETSEFMDSAYFSIFRHSGGDPTLGQNPVNLPVTLSLTTKPEVPSGVSQSERGIQMFYLGNNSNVEVGWTSEVGLYRDDNDVTIFPWDHRSASEVSTNSNKFNLRTDKEAPATLSFDGDFIYLGGSGPNGEASPRLISSLNMGRVIYMGHGSKVQITQDVTTDPARPRPYVGFSDASIGILLWKQSDPYLNPQIYLPFDQMVLKNPIRPYNVDMNLLTDSLTNKHLRLLALTGAGLGTFASISWNSIVKVPGMGVSMGYRTTSDFLPNSTIFSDYRIINRVTSPISMPTQGLLYMTTGDYLDQLAVSGATLADPFLLYLSGDRAGISQVREIVTEYSELPVPGEGAFARIFMDQGAKVGLGTRNTNDKSVNSWSEIGKNSVTLVPNGDCMVYVNSDLLITDAQPIIPTTNFGSQYLDAANNLIKPAHRITFFSHNTHEIRVPTGHELDLSAFGQATTDQSATQQIAIGGKLKLIFEPGSALRFPNLDGLNVSKQPILYLNEDAEIVFESIQDMDNKFIGVSTGKARWDKIRDSDRARTRILGVGQIWVNKSAKITINDNALVSVEADLITPKTNVTLSLQRNARVELGNSDVLGGSLQVGAPLFNPDGTAFSVNNAEINFTLRMASINSDFFMGRNSFLGFGVGVVDRFEQTLNGLWKVQPLKYVKNVNLRLLKGVFSHNQIYDGSSTESSLLAIGQLMSGGKYKFEFGQDIESGILLGGGNLLYVSSSSAALPTDLITVQIDSTASSATTGNAYSILSPSYVLKNLTSLPSADSASTLKFVNSDATAASDSVNFSESGLNNGYGFSGIAKDAYNYLAFLDVTAQRPVPYVALGKNVFENRLGYVLNGSIVRTSNISLESGIKMSDVSGVSVGVLQSATRGSNNTLATNKLP